MWFLRPSRDINLLQQRQKAVSYFMNLRNAELVASLQDCLKHIKNVSVSVNTTAVVILSDLQLEALFLCAISDYFQGVQVLQHLHSLIT